MNNIVIALVKTHNVQLLFVLLYEKQQKEIHLPGRLGSYLDRLNMQLVDLDHYIKVAIKEFCHESLDLKENNSSALSFLALNC